MNSRKKRNLCFQRFVSGFYQINLAVSRPTEFNLEQICIHWESLAFDSVPAQISTAMFINIHWMEISLQNLFPFFQKCFLWKIAMKKLHVLWPWWNNFPWEHDSAARPPVVHFVVSEIDFNRKLACGTTKRPCLSNSCFVQKPFNLLICCYNTSKEGFYLFQNSNFKLLWSHSHAWHDVRLIDRSTKSNFKERYLSRVTFASQKD